jgi:phage/plasmid primase-like uncharacterized protein
MPRKPRLTAADIAHALGGKPSGKGFVAQCPAHEDRTPSLSLADSADGADGRVLVHCHAGCTQEAVIAALSARGLWSRHGLIQRPQAKLAPRDTGVPGHHEVDTLKRALEIWAEALPSEGTLVEAYMHSRGITLQLPLSIRFHERLWHKPSARAWPAMVALITDALTGEPIGVHRTYLAEDGVGKAPIEPSRMILGTARGGSIRLAHAQDELVVGEGVETCLSVQQACGIPSWAALSATGLKAINLPPGIERVIILADGDPTGEAAARAAARRLRLAVRSVRLVRAPHGRDFNDLLTDGPARSLRNE